MLLKIKHERFYGETYLISHSFVLSTRWDMCIHWNACKLHHSGICSAACSPVHTCHEDRLTKGRENRDGQADKRKWEDSFHTYVSHSVSHTSRWRRSSRRGLVGKNEAPCSSGRSHMIAGSFCQTFLLCRLQRAEKANSQMLLFIWFWHFGRAKLICMYS